MALNSAAAMNIASTRSARRVSAGRPGDRTTSVGMTAVRPPLTRAPQTSKVIASNEALAIWAVTLAELSRT